MRKLVETKVYLPSHLVRSVDQLAARTRRPKSEIVRSAVASFLSADGPEQLEAALGRRLDRMSRQLERLERDLGIANEALGLFIRAWLTATPSVAEAGRAAADAKGKERYAGFIAALGRRLASGRSISKEVLTDVPGGPEQEGNTPS